MENQPRVLITSDKSRYIGELGCIISSNCDGTFKVKVMIEGNPVINLTPNEIDPC